MTPHPLCQCRQMAATIRFIAERKNTVAPRAQSVGVDPLSSTDTPSRSPLLAAGAGDPANLPAASARQGGGLCGFLSHDNGDS